MRRAAWKTRLIAPVAEPVSETGIRERSVQIIHKERQVTARRAVYDPLQNWKGRQLKLFRFAVSALALCERELNPARDVEKFKYRFGQFVLRHLPRNV